MPDIFISYSRKDSEQAEQLAEQLRAEGMDVWIDRKGIHGAEKWGTEIVKGINACSTFAVLLSSHSVLSENVLRELSLASEKGKRVLPIDIDRATLPSSFQYPLAGLQRVAISDFESILEAHRHGVTKIAKKDTRKSLMILPFEDLSPGGDNGWFADGIVSELITALSNVKSLRLSDNQATKEFKRYHGLLTSYAREMNIRFFVQGDVRKFGDNIKVSARLLDIETGDYLWQESLKGTMENIFDFQEEVARKVLEGLNVQLSLEETKKLTERGTENAEAYELFLKAVEYFDRQTKEGFQLTAQLCSDAIRLDASYAHAYCVRATALAVLYNSYDRNPKLLEEGLALIRETKRLKPDFWRVNNPLTLFLTTQGKLQEAEEAALDYIQHAPKDMLGHFALGHYYQNTGQYAKAIAPFEEAMKLAPDHLGALMNLVLVCKAAGETEKHRQWSELAIPRLEKHLMLFPEDEHARVNHAVLLHLAGRNEDALNELNKLPNLRDGVSLFNVACLFCSLRDYASGLATLHKALDVGLQDIAPMRAFLEEETEGLGSLRGTPEWEAARERIEKMGAEKRQHA